MLPGAAELQNYTIGATNGTVGHVRDLFFDDKSWVIRCLIMETGEWLTSRQVA
jgi:hypothetical protein